MPLQVFIFGERHFFSPICLLYGKDFFQAFRSIANKRYKCDVTKSVYVAMTIFLSAGGKKKTRNHPFAYLDVHFSCKMMHYRDA